MTLGNLAFVHPKICLACSTRSFIFIKEVLFIYRSSQWGYACEIFQIKLCLCVSQTALIKPWVLMFSSLLRWDEKFNLPEVIYVRYFCSFCKEKKKFFFSYVLFLISLSIIVKNSQRPTDINKHDTHLCCLFCIYPRWIFSTRIQKVPRIFRIICKRMVIVKVEDCGVPMGNKEHRKKVTRIWGRHLAPL